MTIDALKARLADAIILLPDGNRIPKAGELYTNSAGAARDFFSVGPNWGGGPCNVLRRVTLAELLAELDPKLPPVGSVWRRKSGGVTLVCQSDRHDAVFLSYEHRHPKTGAYTAAEFAAWVRETSAVCVYDPSKKGSSDAR